MLKEEKLTPLKVFIGTITLIATIAIAPFVFLYFVIGLFVKKEKVELYQNPATSMTGTATSDPTIPYTTGGSVETGSQSSSGDPDGFKSSVYHTRPMMQTF